MHRFILPVLIILAMLSGAYGAQSTITEAVGYSCMGVDLSKKATEKKARTEVKQNAVENAKTYIKSETKVIDQVLESEIIEAYNRAEVKILQEISAGWYKDPDSGDCYRIKIKAEVIPDEKAMSEIAKAPVITDNPQAPLSVKIWTDKKEYQNGEKMRVYLKGNKPFYARVVYRSVGGQTLQLLPNPYRTDNYFQGGAIYEIPSGNDQFELEVSAPFGEESLMLYASTSPLGKLDLKATGGVYQIKTVKKDIPIRSRGVTLKAKSEENAPSGSEFVEDNVKLKTKK